MFRTDAFQHRDVGKKRLDVQIVHDHEVERGGFVWVGRCIKQRVIEEHEAEDVRETSQEQCRHKNCIDSADAVDAIVEKMEAAGLIPGDRQPSDQVSTHDEKDHHRLVPETGHKIERGGEQPAARDIVVVGEHELADMSDKHQERRCPARGVQKGG